jgi:hypothetical protein
MANNLGLSPWYGLVLLPIFGCSLGGPTSPSDRATGEALADHTSALTEPRLVDRAQLAASRRFLRASAPLALRPADGTWAAALDVADQVTSATLDGDPTAVQVRNDLGIITPVRGTSFVLLSTGVAGAGLNGNATPEPGTDFGDVGEPGDATSLQLTMQVPVGATALSFQYNFLSTEYPEFVGTIFNDTFSVQVDDLSGTRTFNVATVNSAKFFPISDTRGKASGFDLFTDDPTNVDTVFGTGLPDAGLTDFQTFSVPVTENSTITVTFKVQDTGDGILDSAVLLDAVQFFSIDAIDPNPALETAGAVVTGNVEDLATNGRPVRGVVADGATDLLLRVQLPASGHVAFTLPSGAASTVGSLRLIGDSAPSDPPATSLDVTSVQTAAQVNYAFVVYRAPNDFTTTVDDAATERTLSIAVAFTPDAGTGFASKLDLQVKRPPVVFARGLWSDGFYWTPLLAGDPGFISNDARFAVTYAEHTYACNSDVRVLPPPEDGSPRCPWTRATDPNGEVLCTAADSDMFSDPIREAIQNVQRLNIAATRVDVIAQADAGLRAREHINAPDYHNLSNLNAGDVNRLITLNTPHLGSTFADAIVQARDLGGTPDELMLCHARFDETLGDPLGGIDLGDIDGMLTGHTGLAASGVHGHALIGSKGGALPLARYRQRMGALLPTISDVLNATNVQVIPQCATALPRCTSIWGPGNAQVDHDTFATVVSQGGNLPVTATTPLDTNNLASAGQTDDWTDFLHAPRSKHISDRLVALLNTSVDTSTFAPFPAAPAGLRAAVTAPRPAGPLAIPAGSVRIVSPLNGDTVFAGDTVPVQVVGEGGFAPVTVAVVLGGEEAESDTAPFTIPVTVPANALGPTKLIAIGIDATDHSLVSNLVILNVQTRANLQKVHIVNQDPILFGIGKHRQLSVLGTYDDSVVRNITSPSAGTVYLTSNPAIVTVSTSGVLTSVGTGIATVVAQNGLVQDSITVTVRANAAPIARAGADVAAVCALPGATVPVHLDGSGSFDPDADPLTFTWSEAGSPIATGPTPTVLLAAGTHTIALVVFDGASNAEDSVVVTVSADTEPPLLTIVGDNPATTECGQPYTDRGATARDTCAGDLTAAITTQSNVNTGVPGSYAVSYAVTDHANLTATATRSVTVADRTPPVVQIKPLVELFPPDLFYREFHLSDCASAVDACGGPVKIDKKGEIVAIYSDEPDVIFPYDPNHDMVILGPSKFLLRSQLDPFRNGRVYEVQFTVRDDLGNKTPPRSCFFGVKLTPHSAPPIDDGRVFTVRP